MEEIGEGKQAVAPISLKRRVFSLDVIRGGAILGLLLVNIVGFATIAAAEGNPTAYGDFGTSEIWIWRLTHFFGDLKFLSLFAILFGAGVLLMAERTARKGGNALLLHNKRMAALLILGLLHGLLVWSGDVLAVYAICGFCVFHLRKLKPLHLLVVGVGLIAIPSAILFGLQWNLHNLDNATLQAMEETWEPHAEAIQAELAAYRGNYLQQFAYRVPQYLDLVLGSMLTYSFWRISGLMLIGMALAKLNVFQARVRSSRFYFDLFLFGVGIGLPLVAFGAVQNLQSGFFFKRAMFSGHQWNYWGSIAMSIGYAGFLILISKFQQLLMLTGALATVGRMALTNYLLQSLICTFIFYGHGLGHFGRWNRAEMLMLAVVVILFQVVFSVLWLRFKDKGPVEWLLRKWIYKA